MVKVQILWQGQKEFEEQSFLTLHDALCFCQDTFDEGSNPIQIVIELE